MLLSHKRKSVRFHGNASVHFPWACYELQPSTELFQPGTPISPDTSISPGALCGGREATNPNQEPKARAKWVMSVATEPQCGLSLFSRGNHTRGIHENHRWMWEQGILGTSYSQAVPRGRKGHPPHECSLSLHELKPRRLGGVFSAWPADWLWEIGPRSALQNAVSSHCPLPAVVTGSQGGQDWDGGQGSHEVTGLSPNTKNPIFSRHFVHSAVRAKACQASSFSVGANKGQPRTQSPGLKAALARTPGAASLWPETVSGLSCQVPASSVFFSLWKLSSRIV